MKESYREDLASHSGLESYADGGNAVGVASARGTGRPAIELRNHPSRVPTLWWRGKATRLGRDHGEWRCGTAESKNLSMSGNFQAREPGDPNGFHDVGSTSGTVRERLRR